MVRELIDQVSKAVFAVVGIIMGWRRWARWAPWPSPSANTGRRRSQSGGADRRLLPDLGPVRDPGSGDDRAPGRLLDLSLPWLHQGELLIVLGTSSSESALPSLMAKLEALGCPKPVVGLVVPTGYSFNLDGTNIYMTLATLFVARRPIRRSAFRTARHRRRGDADSKGASGVTGAGFVTLAATLSVVLRFRSPAWPDLRHRQVHERVPGTHQHHRQRRRHHRDLGLGAGTRSRTNG